ncbi:MAG TPA: hypothetical protein VGW40_07440 [Allosphingosinicella sp.]|nr:hypothetical protein [Allosphingosinicella sp.]
MTWQIFEAHDRVDERVVARARAEGRKWNMDDMKHLGPEWSGGDRRLNPLHATRPRAFFVGGWLVLVPLLVLLGFVFGPRGMIPKGAVELMLIVAFFPGVAVLAYGFLMPRFLEGLRWRLSLESNGLHYQAQSYWAPFVSSPEGWAVPLASIARVETGATADWEPVRRAVLREKPVPREEVQTFLFMDDGSRRVIATVHGGRESMSTLAHSIRSWLQAMRERMDRTARDDFVTVSGEGFST